MYRWEHPGPVRYVKYKHMRNVPEESKIQMCKEALGRSPPTYCDVIKPTAKGSSPKRHRICKECKKELKNKRNHGARDGGAGGSGGSGGSGAAPTAQTQSSQVQVDA